MDKKPMQLELYLLYFKQNSLVFLLEAITILTEDKDKPLRLIYFKLVIL